MHARSILYYPTGLPHPSWLRQTLLYWDQVLVISRAAADELSERATARERLLTPGMHELAERGYLVALREDESITSDHRKEFEARWGSLLSLLSEDSSESDALRLAAHQLRARNASIFETFGLHQESLWVPDLGEGYPSPDALLLFTKLGECLRAKHIAQLYHPNAALGTNCVVAATLLNASISSEGELPCLSAALLKLLPSPRENVPFEVIARFKERRRDNLLAFRQLLDEFETALRDCECEREIHHILVQLREKIEKGVHDLEAALADARIATLVGTLETLIKPTSPAFWGTALAAAGYVTKASELPPYLAAIGIGTASAIQVGKYYLDRHNDCRTMLRDSQFSYLCYIERELK